jgi:hypothetical protein
MTTVQPRPITVPWSGVAFGNVTWPCGHRLRVLSLPARISAVTLACRDIGRMAAFHRQFGWPEAPSSVPEHVVFQCANGVVLGLFSETVLERQFGRVAEGFVASGFRSTVRTRRRSTGPMNSSAGSTTSPLWTSGRNDQAGDAASASATRKATSETSPSNTVPTSITAAASSTPDTLATRRQRQHECDGGGYPATSTGYEHRLAQSEIVLNCDG